MTLTQLEQYMISEIEILHVKIDSAFELLTKQISELSEHVLTRLDRIEKKLDNHEERLTSLENRTTQAN